MNFRESALIILIFIAALAIIVTIFLYYQRVFHQMNVQEERNRKNNNELYRMMPRQEQIVSQLMAHPPKPQPLITNTCRQTCGENVCRKFEDKISAYRGCEYCQAQGLCYSKPQDSCIKCAPGELRRGCEENYGSEIRGGRYTAPIPPEMNFCKL